MILLEIYKGIEIYQMRDIWGNYSYYQAPTLTETKATVNFAPSINQLKKFIDQELAQHLHINK